MGTLKHLQIDFKAPYYTFGKLDEDTPAIWIACHGYGQLAEYFIRKFRIFEDQGHFGVVLQGLHKFYFTQERVGASWMTKHDREVDLENQFTYYRRVLEEVYDDFDLTKVQVNLLGFSQGVSAIARLLFHLQLPFDNLVLWAGGFPPELSGKDISFMKKDSKLIVAIGDEDEYYDKKNYQINIEYLEKTFNRSIEVRFFPGNHSLEPKLLDSWLKEN